MTRSPRWLLAPLLLAILVAAAIAPWHSTMAVDDRSYLEMIDGVAASGLPQRRNGPFLEFTELRARWNAAHEGRLWGSYPPFYPYLMAVPYRLGGMRAVIALNIVSLALLALAIYSLGRALSGSERIGVASAYLALLSSPLWASAFVASSFTLAITCITWAIRCGVVSLEAPHARRLWILSGGFAGIATGFHLLSFPMLLALTAALYFLPERSARRGLTTALAAAVPLLLLAWLNHKRFGEWNPISYGPCPWRACTDADLAHQTAGASLAYAAPVLVWATAAVVVAWLVRRSKVGLVLVTATAFGLLLPSSPLRTHAAGIATLTWALVADAGRVSFGRDFFQPPDGLGSFLGPYVIKSILQGTPLLALAALGRLTPESRKRAALCLLPCAALFAALLIRANLPLAFALGYPFLHFRYALFATPILFVLVGTAVRDLPWRSFHAAVAIAVAVAVGGALTYGSDDSGLWRRLLLLRGSLLLALAAFVLLARFRENGVHWGRAAAIAVAAAAGFGVAVTLCVDLRALVTLRNDNDRRLDRFLAETPHRFALIGWPREIDPMLAAIGSRQIEYADLYELTDWTRARPLLDHWAAEQRPIFGLLPADDPPSPWPDLRFELVDPTLHLIRIVPAAR